jgi:hypothetical protein
MLSQLDLSDVVGAGDLFSAADKKKLLQAAGQAHVTLLTPDASGAETSPRHRQDIRGCLSEQIASQW